MAVLFVQLQAPDAGLYSIPWTDCTEKPSGTGAETQHYNIETLFHTYFIEEKPTLHFYQTFFFLELTGDIFQA